MAFNGSGTFLINSSGQPVVTATVISSTVFNALTADIGTGLSTCITKDGQTATTARIPFANGINSTLATDATSIGTGSILTAGGVGITKALWVGGLANIAGALTVTGHATFEGVTSTGATGTGALVFATSPTLVTPTIGVATGTRLGLGAAADANHLLFVSSGSAGYGIKILDTTSAIPVLNLSTSVTSGGNIRNWIIGPNYAAVGELNIRCSTAEGGDPYSAGATYIRIGSSGHFQPGTDNAQDLGTSGIRWKDGYFGGTLRFGTRTALGAETLSGYITITDAGGTTRKLAVIS